MAIAQKIYRQHVIILKLKLKRCMFLIFVRLKEIHKQILTLHIEMHQRNVLAKKLHAIFTHPVFRVTEKCVILVLVFVSCQLWWWYTLGG